MKCLRNAASIDHFLTNHASPELAELINERMAELADYDDYDIAELVHFLVVDPGDSQASISRELGFAFGDPSRPWESISTREPWHEVLYVLGDDGFGLVIYIPTHDLEDRMLAELFQRSSTPVELGP